MYLDRTSKGLSASVFLLGEVLSKSTDKERSEAAEALLIRTPTDEPCLYQYSSSLWQSFLTFFRKRVQAL